MTHANDAAQADPAITDLVEKLDAVCSVCRKTDCGHFDAHFSGLVPFDGDDQLHAESSKA
ncbi:hypothetical protein ABIC16_002231 [Sphingomonas sp. PvP055]|uniref:hypothetical protein n=1 Tax=Sphingomonas sp. PvP055 TaxID=3156391 RepID=UPI0033919E11